LPDLRLDPITGLRVIVAGDRGVRPGAWLDIPERPAIDPATDPFAEGNEAQTPPEVYALRDGGEPDGPGWRVRVVPNLYPALVPGEPDPVADPLGGRRGEPDLFVSRPAQGGHELIVNSPKPVWSLADLEPEDVEAAMGVWRERIRAHADAAYVHVIVNEGREAGSSLPHTHAQLYALPFVPAQVARERERFTAYWEHTQGRNLLADLLQEEVKQNVRVAVVDSEAVVLCPFAARMPFHMQVVPRRPVARFEEDGPLGAAALHRALNALREVLGALPPLNMWVRTAPSGAERFCWRIDVMPRLAQLAGLELGAGVHLNVLTPEDAAERLAGASV
jgi:UDPglucose--hexose-1-phosphate uridylyltransferase